MPDHNYFANLLWQIADLLRGPYRPPQYERVMLPMTVLRRFDCVLAPTKAKVLAEFDRRKSRFEGEALESWLNRAAGQRFHNRSRLDFGRLKGDPDNIERHLIGYINGFSKNVRDIFEFFELESEIEKMREANILYLVVSKLADIDFHPAAVPNEQMGLIFESLIRRFNELANETAGDHFTPSAANERRVRRHLGVDGHRLRRTGCGGVRATAGRIRSPDLFQPARSGAAYRVRARESALSGKRGGGGRMDSARQDTCSRARDSTRNRLLAGCRSNDAPGGR